MKKSLIAMAALASIGDIGFVSARKSFDEAHGHEATLQGTLATNVAYTATGGAGDNTTHRAIGLVVYPATAIVAADSTVILCGFKPRRVTWENVTDRTLYEWREGMAADSCVKTAANGTRTLEITSGNGGITVGERGFSVLQNATLAAILASKTCAYEAWA